ncbi:MAG: hypothetical protein KDB32_04525, partial [Planctomycetes bacterium]|nr:hypothetical protein [Planctomycetota bacterium]
MDNNADNQRHIQWTRLWCPREGTVHIDEQGFLVKASIGEEDFYSPDAKPLPDHLAAPCLILLGPPGMGKTTEIETAYASDTGPRLSINLGDVTSDSDLHAKLSGNPTVMKWQQDKPQAPTLWLDSLDEALADVANIVKALKAELRKLKQAVRGLRLRIACRVADWLPSLEGAIREVWGGEYCQTIQLEPLRREDVKAAAKAHGLSAQAFMEAVFAAKAGPLAAKPVTLLNFLLREFKDNHGALPDSQVALYESGCRRLVDEWADHRREQVRSANDDAESRFQTAQRVAAAMTFYGRDKLDCRGGEDETADGAVHSREIGTASSSSEDIPRAPSIQDVENVAHTALMSGDAVPHLYHFGHRTFQEFLAALFLHEQMTLPTSPMPLPKVLTLFLNPNSNDKRIVPQLLETAAWLAAMNGKFRAALLEADPVAVLHSDVARQDDATQRKLFEALCNGLRKREISAGEWRWRTLRGLNFEGIASELQKILSDTRLHEELHRLAIDLAAKNEVAEVYDKLADLALDTRRSEVVRRLSAHAIAHAPDTPEAFAKAKARLAPLLRTTPADDPNDTLRGNALYTLWRTLEPEALFALLTPPRNASYSGAYWMFSQALMRSLEVQHLTAGLDWAAKQPRVHDMSPDFRRLMQRVFNLAWLNLDAPDVLEALANALAVRTEHYESVRLDYDGEDDYDRYNLRGTDKPSELTSNDPEVARKRRTLCQTMVLTMAGRPKKKGQTGAFAIAHYIQLAQPADFEWLLEQHLAAKHEAQRALWLELATKHWAAWRGAQEQVAVIRNLEAQSEDIREAFRVPIALLDPNSPESVAQREEWERHERELQAITEKRNAKLKLLDPPPARRIVELLDDFEKGDVGAFWRVLDWADRDEYGRRHFGILDFDPRKTIGWKNTTPETHVRLIAAAEKYLGSSQESPDEWVGADKLHLPSIAGLSALILLYHEQRDV